MERDQLRGPVNVVSPAPVRNEDFTRELAEVLHRPALLPVPRLLLRVALGELSGALLESQRVTPRAALGANYSFSFPELSGALSACLHE